MLRRSLLRSTTFLTATLVASSTGVSLAQATCSPIVWNLTAGQTDIVGTVTVWNNETTLFVEYKLNQTFVDAGARFGSLHLWVGNDLATLPKNQAGNLRIGHFPFKYEIAGSKTYLFALPFADLAIQDIPVTTTCDSTVYVVAHAEVKYPSGSSETAFGGDQPVNIAEPGRWWFYGVYKICCDDGTPVLGNCETAFAKGGYVFTGGEKKSNPDNLLPLNLTKNRWGWAINLVAGKSEYDIWAGAGLNNTKNGDLVGKLYVDWTNPVLVVKYVISNDFGMKELHIYASDKKPTTVAPGQYGYTEYFQSHVNTFEKTFVLSESMVADGWLIAHAVTCAVTKP